MRENQLNDISIDTAIHIVWFKTYKTRQQTPNNGPDTLVVHKHVRAGGPDKSKVEQKDEAPTLQAMRLRSIRMFLLKCLERTRGVSFVRSALQQRPLRDSVWLKQWLETNDTGLVRFLGSNKLPRNNPLKAEVLWDVLGLAAGVAMSNNGTTVVLEKAVLENSRNPAVKGTLLAVLFHEVYLLQLLPNLPLSVRKQIQMIQKWLLTTPSLSFLTPQERQLISFFTMHHQSSVSLQKFLLFVRIEFIPKSKTISHILRLTHLALCAWTTLFSRLFISSLLLELYSSP